MKFIATTVFAATAVSAAVIKRADFLSVRNFSASCIPHSTLCNYNFTAQASSDTAPPAICALTLQGPDVLPDVELTSCDRPSYSFAVSRPADGSLALTIIAEVSTNVSNVTGTFPIGAGNLTTTTSGASTSESYIGPAGFDITGFIISV